MSFFLWSCLRFLNYWFNFNRNDFFQGRSSHYLFTRSFCSFLGLFSRLSNNFFSFDWSNFLFLLDYSLRFYLRLYSCRRRIIHFASLNILLFRVSYLIYLLSFSFSRSLHDRLLLKFFSLTFL